MEEVMVLTRLERYCFKCSANKVHHVTNIDLRTRDEEEKTILINVRCPHCGTTANRIKYKYKETSTDAK